MRLERCKLSCPHRYLILVASRTSWGDAVGLPGWGVEGLGQGPSPHAMRWIWSSRASLASLRLLSSSMTPCRPNWVHLGSFKVECKGQHPPYSTPSLLGSLVYYQASHLINTERCSLLCAFLLQVAAFTLWQPYHMQCRRAQRFCFAHCTDMGCCISRVLLRNTAILRQ